jgi:arylsulfatase A-like enzyme
MKSHFGRRDFIKIASLMPLAAYGAHRLVSSNLSIGPVSSAPNVLILVFDTLSALNVSLYGYARETMPNLERFAERATVYHAHYSAGNYTTPGTASLLTGTYPWGHRAFSHEATVADEYTEKNLFSAFKESGYTRLGFSHNYLVNILLYPFRQDMERFVMPSEVALVDYNFSDDIFFKDYVVASRSERVYLKKPGKISNSLFFFPIFWALKTIGMRRLADEHRQLYPRGMPGYHDMLYPLEGTVDWIMSQLRSLPQPFLAYMHMMPPHDPYLPSREFLETFNDERFPSPKPEHFYSEGFSVQTLIKQRQYYDEYVAYVDAHFGHLYDFMQEEGILDNTWVVFTSDHGEMFERGIWKHTTRTLFEPIIRVPLLISQPGQRQRLDITTSTSCVDLLPTLLHVTGQPIPEWCQGEILPPFNIKEIEKDRSLFVVEAKSNPKFGPLKKATLAMIKPPYKLIYYTGYEGFDGVFELYDLERDPDELEDLYPSGPSIAAELKNELLTKIQEVNKPFARK